MIDADFVSYSVAKLEQYLVKIESCLSKLHPDQIWMRGSDHENSMGNLCLHLSGNLRQWIVSGVGGAEDHRNRDSEFASRGGKDPQQLSEGLREAVNDTVAVIGKLTPERLADEISVQGYEMTVLQAVYHVVEHFAYHAGQIVFATKAYTGEDMGFYRHLKQAGHGEKTP